MKRVGRQFAGAEHAEIPHPSGQPGQPMLYYHAKKMYSESLEAKTVDVRWCGPRGPRRGLGWSLE